MATPDDNSHLVNNALAGIANYASLATANLHREILRGDLGGCEDFSAVLADLARINDASRSASLLFAPPVETAAAKSETEGRTVLLVDDNAAVRDSTRRLLEMEGYAVLEAADARAALAISTAHSGTIDLLLTDFAMAGGNGQDLQGAVAAARPDTKILFMTGYAAEALARQGSTIDSGIVLQKPFTADGLYRKIAAVLVTDG